MYVNVFNFIADRPMSIYFSMNRSTCVHVLIYQLGTCNNYKLVLSKEVFDFKIIRKLGNLN